MKYYWKRRQTKVNNKEAYNARLNYIPIPPQPYHSYYCLFHGKVESPVKLGNELYCRMCIDVLVRDKITPLERVYE